MDSSPDFSSAPLIAGKYRVVRELGRGGMATVYEAVHEQITRRVAIKVLHPGEGGAGDVRKRFEAEARTSAIVDSPHLVKVIDYGQDGARPYIVMEVLRGETLAARMKRTKGGHQPMELPELLAVATQVLDALVACHEAGVVHRDLKPSNIWLAGTEGGTPFVKLLDFGVARFLNQEAVADLLIPKTACILGTPKYMAPEQTTRHEVDGRADLYAVGVLLFKALSGVFPHASKGYTEHVVALRTTEAPPLLEKAPEVDPALASIVDRALQHSVDDRFQSARSMLRVLLKWSERRGLFIDAPLPPSVASPTSSGPRKRVMPSFAAAPDAEPTPSGVPGWRPRS